jgi:hypothetical protein
MKSLEQTNLQKPNIDLWQAGAEGKWECRLAVLGLRFLSGSDENVLELANDDGYTTLYIHKNHHIAHFRMVCFMGCRLYLHKAVK